MSSVGDSGDLSEQLLALTRTHTVLSSSINALSQPIVIEGFTKSWQSCGERSQEAYDLGANIQDIGQHAESKLVCQ